MKIYIEMMKVSEKRLNLMLKKASLDATWLWTWASVRMLFVRVCRGRPQCFSFSWCICISPRKLFIVTMKNNVYLLMYRFGHPDFHFVVSTDILWSKVSNGVFWIYWELRQCRMVSILPAYRIAVYYPTLLFFTFLQTPRVIHTVGQLFGC